MKFTKKEIKLAAVLAALIFIAFNIFLEIDNINSSYKLIEHKGTHCSATYYDADGVKTEACFQELRSAERLAFFTVLRTLQKQQG